MYMIYQQYTTAVKAAYAAAPDVAAEAQMAKSYRQWLETLQISPHLRNPLVEQARVLEEALTELAHAP